MEKQVTFNKNKFVISKKVSAVLLPDILLNFGRDDDDILKDLFTVQLEAFVLSHTSETRTLEYLCPKPSFLDWLLGRKEIAKFRLDVNDLLLNPPKIENTLRTYRTQNL